MVSEGGSDVALCDSTVWGAHAHRHGTPHPSLFLSPSVIPCQSQPALSLRVVWNILVWTVQCIRLGILAQLMILLIVPCTWAWFMFRK